MKYIYLILLIWNITLYAEHSTVKTISTDKLQEYEHNLLVNFNGDFTAIDVYLIKLYEYEQANKILDFNIKLINALVAKYDKESVYVHISYLYLAQYYLVHGNIDIAKQMLSYSNDFKENVKYKNDDILHHLYHMMNALYEEKIGSPKKSYFFYLKAYEYNQKLYKRESLERISLLNTLARVSLAIDKKEDSIKYVQESINIAKKLRGVEYLCSKMETFDNNANLFKDEENYQGAALSYAGAIKVYESTKSLLYIKKDFPCIILTYTAYADVLLSQNMYTKAIKEAEKALALSKKLAITGSVSEINNLNLIAYIKKIRKNYEEAKSYYNQSLNLLKTAKFSPQEKQKYTEIIEERIVEIENIMKGKGE